MKQENFEYLTDNIKYMGFGEELKADLEKNLKEGKDEFQLFFKTEFNQKPFAATLNFRRSDSSDMYFFNNYHASLERTNGSVVDRTFFLYKGKGITAKEAFNLLDGRAVHKDLVTKDGKQYQAWTQLDFETRDKNNNYDVKQFHENYGFNLKEALAKLPLTEIGDTVKENQLMQSLQKGNLQAVTIEGNGTVGKFFIEANPQYKTINVYNANMTQVVREKLENYRDVAKHDNSRENTMAPAKKKEMKSAAMTQVNKGADTKAAGLLPKRKIKTKKGLGIA